MRPKSVDAATSPCYHPGPDINAGKIPMTTPHQIENTANVALAALLQPMLPGYAVRGEQTRTVAGHRGQHPDVLITAAGRSPVVIEAEYAPDNPEADARQRLGLPIVGETRPVEAAIALRYPEPIGTAASPSTALATARMPYCILYENGCRFPESGWLDGGIADLADLIRLISVPQKAVDAAADDLQQGIDSAANVLNQMPESRPDISPAIAQRLNINDVPQMRRMACAIIANAMLFHERLVGRHGIKPLQQICNSDTTNPQAEILAAWNGILDINYLDIFEIARDIVAELPTREAAQILNIISFQVLNIAARGVNNDHDLTGQVFQRLIADRKYLATFYTLPPSAALLARLAVSKMDGTKLNWNDAAAIGQLRIADFACGTGALLSAVYEQIAARHERAGGTAAALHPIMLEQVIYGCDVMPSAIHITGSTLAGLQPTVGFTHSNLHTMQYGRQDDGNVRIGSLEMLDANSQLNTTMPDGYFDLVIMNPPFTRNVTHEGAYADTVNAAFAAFGASEDDQRDMAKRMAKFKKGTCFDGNAGFGTAFAALGDRKLKEGGILAMVLPLSTSGGSAWKKVREMLGNCYADLTVLSITANGKGMSFSSDTGMAECLVLARKIPVTTVHDTAKRAYFVALGYRPKGLAESASVAKSIIENGNVRGIEDGPYGGVRLQVGDDLAGQILATPHQANEIWGSVRISDYSLAQTAYALAQSLLWLPGQLAGQELPVAPLGSIGKRGLYHLDITGAPPRGPFNKVDASPTATYPALWNHNATKETRIVCKPDFQLEVRRGLEQKAATAWATASRSHLNFEFTFGSQPLAIAFTILKSMGSSVWPNIIFDDDKFDYAFAVWGNSTLGLLSYWWHSNRQQSSKARMTVRSAESLPILDFRALTDEQLAIAQAIFDDFRDKDLMPAYLADADSNRALLDRRVVCDLLGFDDAVYRGVRRLAAKWCAEPSVHGGKQRPASARFVE